MGITFTDPNPDSISFPAEERPKIKININHNDNNPSLTIETEDESSEDAPQVHRTIDLSNGEGGFKKYAVSMVHVEDEVIVTWGLGKKTEENPGFYGEDDREITTFVGSVDLRDVRAAGGLPILSRPYPVYFELEDLTPDYDLHIVYKAIKE